MTTKKPPAAASKRPQKAAKPTAKAKVPAATKKAPERVLVRAKTVAKASTEKQFVMPMEIKDWIDRAHSTMNHQRGEIERLKAENAQLKAYKKWAEHRILRSDHE